MKNQNSFPPAEEEIDLKNIIKKNAIINISSNSSFLKFDEKGKVEVDSSNGINLADELSDDENIQTFSNIQNEISLFDENNIIPLSLSPIKNIDEETKKSTNDSSPEIRPGIENTNISKIENANEEKIRPMGLQIIHPDKIPKLKIDTEKARRMLLDLDKKKEKKKKKKKKSGVINSSLPSIDDLLGWKTKTLQIQIQQLLLLLVLIILVMNLMNRFLIV